MTVSVFPAVIRDGLVVDYDLADSRSYVANENRLLYSQVLNNATGWTTDNCNVTADSMMAPDGTLTGDTLTSTITGGINNAFIQQTVTSLPTSTTFTYSVYLKRGTSPTTLVDFFVISPYTEVVATVTWSAVPTVAYSFGGAANASTLLNSSFTVEANGWYRVSMTMSTGTGTGFACRVYVRGQGTNNVSGETVYVWGAQLERSRNVSNYTSTTTTAITRGSTITNLVSTSYPGTINGTLFTNEGQGGLYFNETSANYVSMYTLPDSFWNASSWSVSAWVRPDTTSKSFGDNAVVGHGTAAGSNGLHLGLRNATVYFGFFGNDTGTGNVITSNRWHHVVWVYDNAQKQKIIYLNGALLATSALTGGTGYGGTGTNTEIGRYPWGGSTHYMLGTIGRVQMYNRPLGAPEVSQIYGSLAGRYLV